MEVFLFKVLVKGTRSPSEERIVLNPQKAGNGHFCCTSFAADTWQKNGSASKIVQVNITLLRPSTLFDHLVKSDHVVVTLKEMHVH